MNGELSILNDRWVRASAVALLASISLGATAQDYPSKPVRMVLGFPPGGNVDVVARIVAQKMGEGLGQQVLVENRAGAGSAIANEYVSKAAPYGYTLLLVSGAHVTLAATVKKLPYDPVRDFTFISPVVTYPLVIVVRPDSKFSSVSDLVSYARSNPGKLNYATPGVGTLYHLAIESFSAASGTESTHVPFRGGSEPVTELLAGRTDFLFDALTVIWPQIQAGKLRPLAVTSAARSPTLPNVPTASQSVPNFVSTSFSGIGGPPGMAPALVERLNRELLRVSELPDIRQRFGESGGEAKWSSPEDFRKLVENEISQWKKVVETRRIDIR